MTIMVKPPRAGAVRSRVRRLPFAPPPLALFRRLADDGHRPHTLLLESAEPGSRRTQRSLLVLSSAVSVTCRGGEVTIAALNANGESLLPYLAGRLGAHVAGSDAGRIVLHIPRASDEGSDRDRLLAPSVLTPLREIVRALTPETAHPPEAVFVAGVFAYDLVDRFERLPEPAGTADFPDYRMYLADRLVVIDHQKRQAEVIVNVFGGEHAEVCHDAVPGAIATITATAEACASDTGAWAVARAGTAPLASPAVAVDQDDASYARTVEALKERIAAGEVFQVVPSRTFSLPCADALAAYERLRALDPTPYLFFVNAGDFTLFGASPESAVKVTGRSRMVEISPIAGTCPRGIAADGSPDRELDECHEAALRLDEKENAEHLMLVDLARNDVARVSRPGTRHVAELLRVERYSRVMHLASRVRGELDEGLDALHAYQASMNMGTLTGAPKLRAMQLLRQHEPGRRGHYGGAIGYLCGDGSLDTAIVIRSALVLNGVAHVRAGAGIVHDSVPAREADETRRKAEAVLCAITEAADVA